MRLNHFINMAQPASKATAQARAAGPWRSPLVLLDKAPPPPHPLEMDQTTNLTLMTVLLVLATQVPAVRRQWREDRAGAIKSYRLVAYYLVYCFAGIGLLFALLHHGSNSPAAPLAAIGLMLGWILLGMSWLIKLAPKYRAVGAWLLRPFGILDFVAVAMMTASLVVFFR